MLSATQIARELIAPTRKWHVLHIGGSRAAGKGRFVCTHTGLAWGGASPVSFNAFGLSGHTTSWGFVPVNASGENLFLPGDVVNEWVPMVYGTAAFDGAAEPNSLWAQLCYGSINRSEFPLVHDRLILNGGGARIRGVYRRNAIGISGGSGVRVGTAMGPDAFAHPLVPPSRFSDPIVDTTGSGLAVAEVVIPAGFDWASYPDVGLEWMAEPGGSNPNGTYFQWSDQPWIESDGPCLVYHTYAVNGGRWAYWLNDDYVPLSRWTDYHGLFGPNQILWSSTGVNSWGESIESNAANLAGVFARFRAAQPDGPIVIDTQYPSSGTAGAVCRWREAIFNVASVTQGVLVADTYGLHDFEWWYRNGLIDDGVHAGDQGVVRYMTDFGSLVRFHAGER